ncbi:Predicted membrane protein [Catalinimonas alkaloidigena]|uniref:Predicted membrane protein n=1 Tax=Catalinimonas alkaloidigena TaxID=1075417 RepID=A0A1G9BW08_9BACT|nr:DUF2306 domain-containing protein [Catalinimonas alkaloidigena]SDK43668.1 Predicted membrane protein [Catalinimonas alkaloidigena]
METLIRSLLILHIAAGFTALVAGFIAIVTPKGKTAHRLSGRWYFWGMVVIAITAALMAGYRGNDFLFTVGVFSFFLSYTGYRALQRKRGEPARVLDWMLTGLALGTGVYMVGKAGLGFFSEGSGFEPVLLVFGAFCARSGWQSLREFRRPFDPARDRHRWLFQHLGHMGGAYIATFTAFLVTNVSWQPAWVVWLLPTVIGTPLIAYAIRHYRQRLRTRQTLAVERT